MGICTVFIVGGTVMHACAGWRSRANEALDDKLMVAWSCMWCFVNAIFMIVAFVLRRRNGIRLLLWTERNGFSCLRATEVGADQEIMDTEPSWLSALKTHSD